MYFVHFTIYLLLAAIVGFVSGLLGGGIGFIIVPLMAFILSYYGVSHALVMHVAIGTGLASFVIIGSVASFSHLKRGAVSWDALKKMLLFIVLAVILGSILGKSLSGSMITILFAVLVFLLAIYTLLPDKSMKIWEVKHPLIMPVSGCIIGVTSGLVGVNPFCVPFFKKIGMDIRHAIGSSAVIGTVMSLVVTIMFIIVGWGAKTLPPFSTGYVVWSLAIPFGVVSSIFAPLGAKITHVIPRKALKISYGCLLLIIGIKMILAVMHFS